MSSVQKFTHECFRSSQNSYIKELANYCRKITKFGGNIQVAHHSLGPSLPSRTETSAMATKNYVKTDIRVFCLGQVCSIFYFWPNIYFFLQYILSQTLEIHRTALEGRRPSFIPLYQFHPLRNIQIFISNFVCVSRIFNRTACIYQTDTR